MTALILRTAEFLFYHLLLSAVDRVSRLPRDTTVPEAMRLYRENIALSTTRDAHVPYNGFQTRDNRCITARHRVPVCPTPRARVPDTACPCARHPWFNRVSYFGVLSSHSKHRAEVCPGSSSAPGRFAPEPAAGDQLTLEAWFDDILKRASLSSDLPEAAEPQRHRSRWAWLLKRVFRADVDTCSRCGGAMRWTEVATEQDAIARLLAKHGLAPQPPPTRHVVPLGQLGLPFGQ